MDAMKRITGVNGETEYENAIKRVNLVERSTNPSGVQLVNVNRVGKHNADDIVALAHQIQSADSSIKNTACGKLTLILEQIRFLQSQAQKILEESEESNSLHEAACNFRKIPGQLYHLYKRASGQSYFSMLSPEEWGASCPHGYLGSYQLESDLSWTPIAKISEKSKDRLWAEKLLDSKSGARNLLAIDYADAT